MPNGLTPKQIDDMVQSTLPHLGKFKWTDISYDLQEHVAFSRLLRKDRVTFQGGESIDMNVKVNQSDVARWTGLYDTDDIQVNNLLDKGNIPWCMFDTHFAFDVRESVFNRGASAIVDMLKVRRQDAMVSLAGLLENSFWSVPDTGPSNRKMYGLGYWLTRNASEGFNGGNPAGFSDVGGIDSDVHPNWKNYTFQYAALTQTDLFRKVRKACTMTKFISPHANPSYEGAKHRFAFYMNYEVLGQIEEYLDNNNENLGFDFGKYDGKATFRGIPLQWVPYLDADSTNPWIGLDWATFSPVFQSGQWMRYSKPRDTATSSHNTRAIFIDCILNMRCVNRRRNFIGYV